MSKQNKIIIISTFVLCVLVVAFAIFTKDTKEKTSGLYDKFAQCLTNNGAVMYGVEWCSHCNEEKNTFGSSFNFINYIECSENTQLCIDKGIRGYPSWSIGTSTELIEGFDKNTTFNQLSEKTGCKLPQ